MRRLVGRYNPRRMPAEAPAAGLPPGHRIAEYEIVRVLGAGGFGITYLAFDHQLDGPVALKEYFPADLAARVDGARVAVTAPTNRETFSWGLERFLEEARAIHRFRHPNVVQAHRYLEANGTAYIVMEYVEGESLKSILDRRGRLSAEEWRPWLNALLDGLEHVHSHGYLHRDIKPANIVIRAATGEPVLIDFGSARAQQRDRTHTQVFTAGYAPIEQYSGGGGQGPPSDIYSLAAVSYRVLTGEPLPSAPDRALSDDCRPLAESVSGADPTWLTAMDQALAWKPRDRPQTVEAWRAALGARQAGTTEREVPPPVRSVRTRSRHWWWAAPALLALAIVVLRLANGPESNFRRAAEQGLAHAQNWLGTMYFNGRGVPQDDEEAVRWFRRAAEQGLAHAQNWLGTMYFNGRGVPQDDEEAVRWYRRAAEQGLAHAQNWLGTMYFNGRGVPQDDEEAVRWFRRAAEQGLAHAQNDLGAMYFNGRGVPQDDEEAVRWFRRAAEQGLAHAQNWLGTMYFNGRGVPQDDEEAVRWYRRAAEQGFAHAQNDLGAMYFNGRGVPQDDEEAVRWFRRAAEQGLAHAQNWLGAMYFNGRGVPQDDVAAHMWANLAGAQGFSPGVELCETLEKRMSARQIAAAQRAAREWRSARQ